MGIVEMTGIITREIKYGDSSRILTVITREGGRVSVLAGGVRAGRSGMLAATQLFCFAKFTLFLGRSKSLYKLNAAEVIETFRGLKMSLEDMAYAAYLCDITNATVQENHPDPEQLSLLLNALYLLEHNKKPREQVKAAYEFRSLSLQGLLPPLSACSACGAPEPVVFVPSNGAAYCESCKALHSGEGIACGKAILQAISYIAGAEDKHVFSFTLPPSSLRYLSALGEYCTELFLEKHLKTLDYLNDIRALEDENHAQKPGN